jgi:hypothetical protein
MINDWGLGAGAGVGVDGSVQVFQQRGSGWGHTRDC